LAKRSRFSLSENALNTNEESALSPVGAFTAAKWSVRTASTVAYAKSHSFFEFSLCSSRACLGKMIILCINGAKRRGFRTWAATDAGDRRDWVQRSTAGQLVGDLSAIVLSVQIDAFEIEFQNDVSV
jgi:hypothetical protein